MDKAPAISLTPGPYVKILVSDTGPGIEKEHLNKVFEPFFTTKPRGRGTGLGLASAYGIIKNHRGSIYAFSEKGQGATFQIHLPATLKEPSSDDATGESMVFGNETILLVDDEKMVIDVSSALLKRLGYNVLKAHGGEEALTIHAEQADNIDLVILDMIMPEMNGEEVFDRLRSQSPDLKILLSSGYSADGRANKIMEKGCNGFIQKPFDMLSISRKVRQVLDCR